MTVDSFEVSVVTITYNEAENIERFLDQVSAVLRQHGLRGQIIVVDDSSPDGTGEAVRQKAGQLDASVVLVSRPCKLGIGSAYLAGIRRCEGACIVLMDADLSHAPEALPAMVEIARAGQVAAGSRFMPGAGFQTSPWRKGATRLLNGFTRRALRLPLHDYTNGYVAIRRADLERVLQAGAEAGVRPFDHILYGVAIFVLASGLGISMAEVCAAYRFRDKGVSKIGLCAGLKLFFDTVRLTFQCARLLNGKIVRA